ncbi:MAG: type II toxin-antitoxin system VapC family toxin [Intrasporangium sp.]|uniref:type II toxin-antitoxin system VapC family toxin n=1 Tax=Intrasporangium sp. TaxID=1925024 RepID=UPI002648BFFE|nr:type II toxin-antitoxin system VapC family toxin [Intrasporangium sp.]MDN5796481.1 type II toxin-antitoxin system VapC family toxin [Intrasporangium sp.]
MIVIDSSAIVDALVDDPANPDLLALVAGNELHAPSLLDYEVAGALRGHALAERLADEQLQGAVDDFRGLSIERYPLSSMIQNVLDLRGNFTVYDAAYLVLAQALEVPLVTADAKLSEGRKMGVDVQVLRPDR